MNTPDIVPGRSLFVKDDEFLVTIAVGSQTFNYTATRWCTYRDANHGMILFQCQVRNVMLVKPIPYHAVDMDFEGELRRLCQEFELDIRKAVFK